MHRISAQPVVLGSSDDDDDDDVDAIFRGSLSRTIKQISVFLDGRIEIIRFRRRPHHPTGEAALNLVALSARNRSLGLC